uniref:Macaca fascicularis brain cDNA, clone: QflA-18956 n=1 Tax=Macaca fascicularis TaxID=9541 RepID=Q8HXE6_MACFA|nr:hypothetical protein [Macaca fascicularis]BAE89679.1 unnamed protein product [Macaca fascicularis]
MRIEVHAPWVVSTELREGIQGRAAHHHRVEVEIQAPCSTSWETTSAWTEKSTSLPPGEDGNLCFQPMLLSLFYKVKVLWEIGWDREGKPGRKDSMCKSMEIRIRRGYC